MQCIVLHDVVLYSYNAVLMLYNPSKKVSHKSPMLFFKLCSTAVVEIHRYFGIFVKNRGRLFFNARSVSPIRTTQNDCNCRDPARGCELVHLGSLCTDHFGTRAGGGNPQNPGQTPNTSLRPGVFLYKKGPFLPPLHGSGLFVYGFARSRVYPQTTQPCQPNPYSLPLLPGSVHCFKAWWK